MRAHLARLLTLEPDLLLLDEPPTISISKRLFGSRVFAELSGAILVISHDREFLNQLVGSIVEIRQSKLIRLPRQL